MHNFFKSLFKNNDPKLAYSSKKLGTSIIDPRNFKMVKMRSIVGSIDSTTYTDKHSQLIAWIKKHEFDISKKLLDDVELKNHKMALYPAVKGGCFAYGPGCFGPKLINDSSTYVIGDTHGDFESLVAIVDTILDISKYSCTDGPTIYILGDVLDRNGESCMYECVFLMAILQKAFPEEFEQYNKINLGIIKGDHDIALSYNGISFTAAVKPADYCDWLNTRLRLYKNDVKYSYVGRAWIQLMTHCPAAAFVESSGVLLSHGGIPRIDIQEDMKNGVPYLLQSERAATDFEWCRMVDAKNKLLNRGSKTSEIGFQEFDSFNQLFGGKIKTFIFGHQHPAKGFVRFDKFYPGYDIICISSFRKDDVVGGPTIPYFCRFNDKDVNVYSMCPAKYVIRLEEHTTTSLSSAVLPSAPASQPILPSMKNPTKTVGSTNATSSNTAVQQSVVKPTMVSQSPTAQPSSILSTTQS